MPWKPEDAPSHTRKADTPRRKRMFSEVANSVLAKTGSDSRAIKEANAVVGRDHSPKKHWSKR